MLRFLPLTALALGTAVSTAVSPADRDLQCKNLTLPVDITSTVRQFPSNFNISNVNLTAVLDHPPTTVSGDWKIAASYCEPATHDSRREDTLQILLHGAFYTRTYWSGLKYPPHSINGSEYSWIDYAASKGYATLAIDRMCNGESSRPQGSKPCQVENQVAILHDIVQGARSGRYGCRPYSRIILVGHSFGSLILQAFTNSYPKAAEAIILTGFSTQILESNQASIASGGLGEELNALQSPYSSLPNQKTFIEAFYYGAFNLEVAKYDFRHSETFNLWEALTTAYGNLRPAEGYTGSVIVLNGEHDAPSCSGHCGFGKKSLTSKVRTFYPNAKSFSYHNTADTGHVVNLHFTAQESYGIIYDFLERDMK